MSWFLGRSRRSRQPEGTWHDKQERLFLEALNKLKNFHVTEGGGLSIDPEELRDKVIESRERLKHLVDLRHRSTSQEDGNPTPLAQYPQANQLNEGFRETIVWRSHDGYIARYVCVEDLSSDRFAVVHAERFQRPIKRVKSHLDNAMIAERLSVCDEVSGLLWFASLQEAIEALESS